MDRYEQARDGSQGTADPAQQIWCAKTVGSRIAQFERLDKLPNQALASLLLSDSFQQRSILRILSWWPDFNKSEEQLLLLRLLQKVPVSSADVRSMGLLDKLASLAKGMHHSIESTWKQLLLTWKRLLSRTERYDKQRSYFFVLLKELLCDKAAVTDTCLTKNTVLSSRATAQGDINHPPVLRTGKPNEGASDTEEGEIVDASTIDAHRQAGCASPCQCKLVVVRPRPCIILYRMQLHWLSKHDVDTSLFREKPLCIILLTLAAHAMCSFQGAVQPDNMLQVPALSRSRSCAAITSHTKSAVPASVSACSPGSLYGPRQE